MTMAMLPQDFTSGHGQKAYHGHTILTIRYLIGEIASQGVDQGTGWHGYDLAWLIIQDFTL